MFHLGLKTGLRAFLTFPTRAFARATAAPTPSYVKASSGVSFLRTSGIYSTRYEAPPAAPLPRSVVLEVAGQRLVHPAFREGRVPEPMPPTDLLLHSTPLVTYLDPPAPEEVAKPSAPRTLKKRRRPENAMPKAAPAVTVQAQPAPAVDAPKSLLSVLGTSKPTLRKNDPFFRRLENACALTLSLHGVSVNAREVLEALATSGVHVTVDPATQTSVTDKSLLEAAQRAGRDWLAQRAARRSGVVAPLVQVKPPVLKAVPVSVPPPAPVFEPGPTPEPGVVPPPAVPPVPQRHPLHVLTRETSKPLTLRRPSDAVRPTATVSQSGLSLDFNDSQSSFAQSPIGQLYRHLRRESESIKRRFSRGDNNPSDSESGSDGVRTPVDRDAVTPPPRQYDSSPSVYSQPSAPRTPHY